MTETTKAPKSFEEFKQHYGFDKFPTTVVPIDIGEFGDLWTAAQAALQQEAVGSPEVFQEWWNKHGSGFDDSNKQWAKAAYGAAQAAMAAELAERKRRHMDCCADRELIDYQLGKVKAERDEAKTGMWLYLGQSCQLEKIARELVKEWGVCLCSDDGKFTCFPHQMEQKLDAIGRGEE